MSSSFCYYLISPAEFWLDSVLHFLSLWNCPPVVPWLITVPQNTAPSRHRWFSPLPVTIWGKNLFNVRGFQRFGFNVSCLAWMIFKGGRCCELWEARVRGMQLGIILKWTHLFKSSLRFEKLSKNPGQRNQFQPPQENRRRNREPCFCFIRQQLEGTWTERQSTLSNSLSMLL